jgi:TRAP-type C4-dicarboxylate transport system substrate-binding protein
MNRALVPVGTGLAVLSLAASVPWVAGAQETPAAAAHFIAVATLAPSGSTWMRALEAWNRELRRRTHGALQLRFYPNGVQGDESEVVRKIRSHRLDAGAVTAVGLAQIHRPTLAFQIPGMFHSYAQLDHARDTLRPELDSAFDHAGFTLLGWGDVGTEHGFSNHALHTPADLARTRPFQWRDDAITPALFAETGAHGVVKQVPEVLTSLQTHEIDTLIAPPIAVASLQWQTQVTHMTDMTFGMEIGAIVMGKSQFDALPADQRQILQETGNQFCTLMVRNVRRDDDATIPAMQSHGMTVDVLTPAERSQWSAVFTRTRARLAGSIGDAAWIQRVAQAGGG